MPETYAMDPAPEPEPAPAPMPAREELPDLLTVDRPDRHLALRVLLLAGAAVCFVLGVVFWLTPVMTGIPFYILAAVLAARGSRRAARWINAQERRLPFRMRLLLRPKLRRARRAASREGREPGDGRGGGEGQ
jgi:hypothetical protein